MSSRQVIVVDYGIGNVLSVCRAVEHSGGDARLSSDVNEIAAAERIVLPGVGAFGDCMNALRERGLIEPILTFVQTGRPFLGICVGMQILFDSSEEFGTVQGLGLMPGVVAQIPTAGSDGTTRKIPHIGWTKVTSSPASRWSRTLFADVKQGTPFYFVHSFTAVPAKAEDLLAVADYAEYPVTAAVARDNIVGVQFHPEKSGPEGLSLLQRFLKQ